MKKIRIISLLLTFIMVIGFLGACNGSSSDDEIVTVDSPYGKTFDLKPAKGVDGDALMLVENGRTNYKIVISDTATTYEKTAGSEMQTFIQKSTGVKIPIITDKGLTYDNNNYYMSIGPTTLFDALAEDKEIDVNYDELGERGSIIHLEGNSLYLNGAAGYGTLNSVYNFLDCQVNFEAYAVDEIYVDVATSIQVYNYKNTKFIEKIDYQEYEAGRIRPAGAVFDAARLGLVAGSNGGVTIDGPLYVYSPAHTLQILVPADKAEEGWWRNSQLCLTNPDVMDFVEQASKEYIEKYKTAKFLVYGGRDNFKACDCDTCKAEEVKYGGAGGSMIKFCNEMSRRLEPYLEETGRDITFIALSYHAYEKPPVYLDENGKYQPIDESVVARDNVGSMVCFIGADYGHSLDDPTSSINVAEYEKLKGWAALTDKMIAYLYLSNYSNYMMYFNGISSFQGWMRTLQEYNVIFPFTAISESEYSPLVDLKLYLLGKLGSDATVESQEKLTKDFMANFYKAAGNDMYEFYNAMRMHMTAISAMNDNNQSVACYDTFPYYSDGKHYPINVLNNFLTYIESAYENLEKSVLSEEDKATVAKRILVEDFHIRYARYQYHRDYFTSEQLVAEKAFLNASAKTLGIKNVAERTEWVDL